MVPRGHDHVSIPWVRPEDLSDRTNDSFFGGKRLCPHPPRGELVVLGGERQDAFKRQPNLWPHG